MLSAFDGFHSLIAFLRTVEWPLQWVFTFSPFTVPHSPDLSQLCRKEHASGGSLCQRISTATRSTRNFPSGKCGLFFSPSRRRPSQGKNEFAMDSIQVSAPFRDDELSSKNLS